WHDRLQGPPGPAQLNAQHDLRAAVDKAEQAEQQRQGDRADVGARQDKAAACNRPQDRQPDQRPGRPRITRAEPPYQLHPAVPPARTPAQSATRPPRPAQAPMTRASTSAGGAGQTRATTPAAKPMSPSSRWPNTGPAVRLLNARADSSPASRNAYAAKSRTSA